MVPSPADLTYFVEVANTQVLFTKPSQTRTEDYITGRFG